MAWTSNHSVSRLFLTHDVTFTNQDKSFTMHIPSLRETIEQPEYLRFADFLSPMRIAAVMKVFKQNFTYSQVYSMLLCNPLVTNLKEFRDISNALLAGFRLAFPQFRITDERVVELAPNVPLDDEVFSEVTFHYPTALGHKVERIPVFGPNDAAARQFYERTMEAKAKAQELKQKQAADEDGLMSVFTIICYKWNYRPEELYDLTFEQVYYLQHMAQEELSYEHSMAAYVNGNLKKAPKFFIK